MKAAPAAAITMTAYEWLVRRLLSISVVEATS
jgi:hypothetical protein